MQLLSILFRNLPEFKGKKRLARFAFGNTISKKNIDIRGRQGIRYLLPNIVENIGFDIFVNGVYEQETINFICKRIKQNGVLLDIGANIGAICIPVKDKRNDISIFAIEASPKVFKYLQKNVTANESEIQLMNKAVAEEPGLSVEIFSPDNLFGKGSQSAVYTNKAEHVDTTTIDQLQKDGLVREISFIKIDIEGYEYFAFKGGEHLLSGEDAPDILFEFNFSSEDHAKNVQPGDAQRLLKSFGYSIYKPGPGNSLLLQDDIIVSGSYLLFASKKEIFN